MCSVSMVRGSARAVQALAQCVQDTASWTRMRAAAAEASGRAGCAPVRFADGMAVGQWTQA